MTAGGTVAIDPDPAAQARTHRSTRLRAAVVTGGVAKVLAVAVQLVAVGIAARALGSQAFGSYLVMASVVAWLGLAAVGVGPGLTQRMAVTTANEDAAGQARAFSSSIALSGLFVLVAAAAVLTIAWVATSGERSQSALGSDVRSAAALLGLATGVQVWLSVVEAAQLGHQEQHFTNVFYAVGLACVLAILLVAGPALTTVTGFVAATAVPPVVAKVANASVYVARRRYLLTRHVSVRESAGVLSTSVAFAAISFGSLASQQLGFLWLAYVAGPAATIPLGVMFRLTWAAFGAVVLVTQPMWPAVADAVAHDDSSWARRVYRRVSWLTVLYAAVFAVSVSSIGSLLIQLWTGTDPHVPQLMLVLFGLYFIVVVWGHVNAITLVGLGKVWIAAAVICVEAAVSSLGAVLLIGQFGGTGVILSLLVASSMVSGILLPLAVRRWWPHAARVVDARAVVDSTLISR